ncbi:PH domain-containing protein [Agathobaculum sp. Marseille-P7918]|uniref:PH domain-containing protein n=1 Tax=Agathobaculum sp. Marseille-P7918 TaxID=2479843 RepID=UPI0035618E99
MRTAEEMIQFCVANHLGQGSMKSWDVKHFTLIQNALQPDEQVLFVFEGLHNYQSASKHDGNYAYAVTNRRFILAQKKFIGENLISVALDQINDITFSSGLALGTITVDTIREQFKVAFEKNQAKNVSERLHNLLIDLKQPTPTAQSTNTQKEVDDQINLLYELKELLDAGVLTQEEFDAKKKQILGL